MSKYLDETGLGRVWSNIKTYLSNNYVASASGVKKIWSGTAAQYNALSSKSSDTLYIIT
jgi:hypothetical protein